MATFGSSATQKSMFQEWRAPLQELVRKRGRLKSWDSLNRIDIDISAPCWKINDARWLTSWLISHTKAENQHYILIRIMWKENPLRDHNPPSKLWGFLGRKTQLNEEKVFRNSFDFLAFQPQKSPTKQSLKRSPPGRTFKLSNTAGCPLPRLAINF